MVVSDSKKKDHLNAVHFSNINDLLQFYCLCIISGCNKHIGVLKKILKNSYYKSTTACYNRPEAFKNAAFTLRYFSVK